MTTTLEPDEVVVGTANGPGIWIADAGTAAPTDTWDAPGAGWSTLGYLSEDGVTFASNTDSESIKPWQSKAPVRTIITGRELSAEFTMIQISPQNLALYFGTTAPTPDGDGQYSIEVRSDDDAINYALLVDVQDGDTVIRYWFPRATLSAAGDIEVSAGAAVPLPVTLSALDDAGTLAEIFVGPAVEPGS